ncbi:MAG: BamA/TamA family outer membrane protein [Saprospiraceae bacterium]|nr:BamA/TamA family outer membrane protein [Saprospiraceae bacterium]
MKPKKLEAILYPVLTQTPNTKSFGLFRTNLWYYYNTRNPADTTVMDKFIKKRFAEPPVLVSEDEAEKNEEYLKTFLVKKGYRSAQVDYNIKAHKKKGTVIYNVNPGQLLVVDSLVIAATDARIDSMMEAHREDSYLLPGNPLDEALYNLEKFRITRLLQNDGYYAFTPDYIELQGDTSHGKLRIRLGIFDPEEGKHFRYRIAQIRVFDNFYDQDQWKNLTLDTFDQLTLLTPANKSFYLRPSVINSFIYTRPDSYYSKEQETRTINKLNSLQTVRLVRLRTEVNNDQLTMNYFVPRQEKFAVDYNLELAYSVLYNQSVGRSLFSISGNTRFSNRNLFKGGETLTTSFQVGTDINLRQVDRYGLLNAFSTQFQNEIKIPKFIDLYGFMHLGNRIRMGKDGLIKDAFLRSLKEEATTRLNLSYEYLSLLNFYNYHSLNSSFGFQLNHSQREIYQFDPIGVSLWLPQTKPAFDTILTRIPYLERSFGQRLFTGFLFRNVSIDYSSINSINNKQWRIIGNFESSGHEIGLANWLINGYRDTFRLSPNTEFSQFVRAEADFRRYYSVGGNSTLALRFSGGVAAPFGGSSNVPYIKQFFLGGPLSIRAWRVRELGPGSYVDTQQDSIERDRAFFYQAGDFKLEFNAELRFPLFWRFAGAVFLDGGNIWSLRPKSVDDRPGARLTKNWIHEIAIGSGFGLRTDFSFFILRLDLGIKLRNPYRNENGSYFPYNRFWEAFRPRNINPNIALDFPF